MNPAPAPNSVTAQQPSVPDQKRAPWWRSEPYRLFFPLGAMLSWAGVAPWLLLGLGVIDDYRSIYHAMAQVQGFLTSFAVGFLFTMIPKRTRTTPPNGMQILLCAGGVVGCTIAAWFQLWGAASICWLVAATTVVVFLIPRVLSSAAKRRPPNAFVWLPAAFAMGITGTILAGLGGYLGSEWWGLHQVGRGLVLQGMFIGLVAGVGSFAIPLMCRGEPPPDGNASNHDRALRAAHLLAAAVLASTFYLEHAYSVGLGYGARAGIITLVLVPAARLWLPPTRPGVLRWFIWFAAWCVPAGYALGAVFADYHQAGLHLTFVAGLALLTYSVGAQVTLGHGGREALRDSSPTFLWIVGLLLIAAAVPRALMVLNPHHFLRWTALAAGLFLGASILWFAYLLPTLLRHRLREQQ